MDQTTPHGSPLRRSPAFINPWIRLNVGGTIFLTTRTTVMKDPNCLLCRLIDSELGSRKDNKGAYIIDRDPAYFPIVINFLRNGYLAMNKNISEEKVLAEAYFYNIRGLAQALEENIRIRDLVLSKAKENTNQHVNRALNCREDELANIISTLPTGWKMEHIVRIEGTDNGIPEFLCVIGCDDPTINTAPNELDSQTIPAKVLQLLGQRM